MKVFFDQLHVQKNDLESKYQVRIEKLERDLSGIKERITDTSNTKECYFVKILEKTYEECSTVTGWAPFLEMIKGIVTLT